MRWIALLLISIIPQGEVTIEDRVDMIERHHLMCQQTGREQFDQVIYWRWDEASGGHRVLAWRMYGSAPALFVRTRTGWRESRRDGDFRRVIAAPLMIETWSLDDPEWIDRSILPQEKRRGLSRPE